MNESIIKTTKGFATNEFMWKSYASSHLLANTTHRDFIVLQEFVKVSQRPGTRVTVDSYLFENFEFAADQAYELEQFAKCWVNSEVTIVPDITAIPVVQQYDNVIAVGTASFKYNTLSEYANCVEHLLRITHPGGCAVVCLPKLHLIYHRLRYQPGDLITELSKIISGSIVNSIELDHDFYLKIQK